MKYFASCSFGKDSIATILLAIEHNEPLNGVVYSEVMFDMDNDVSGECPEHIEWVRNHAIPKLESMGCTVHVLRSQNHDYLSSFFHVIKKSAYPDRIGKFSGFPMCGKCAIQIPCKIQPIKSFYRQFDEPVVQYIGIAVDEPDRLERMHKDKNKISLLEKYNMTEADAFALCEKYDLVSPIYRNAGRNGCWFCPNQPIKELAALKMGHPDLFNKLHDLSLIGNTVGNFKYNTPFSEIEKKVDEYVGIK